MSPKRIAIFLMLVVSWPFWLLLRARFGTGFLVLLLAAWGLGYAVTWGLMQPAAVAHWSAVPELDLLRQLLPLLHGLYRDTITIWGAQLAFAALQRLGVVLGECALPHRWYTGCFWLCRYNYAVPDILGLGVVWFLLAGVLSNRVDALADIAPGAAGIAAGAFALLAYASFLNGHNLPFAAPATKADSRPRRYLARLRSSAARSREGLGHIFSRRDPALTRMARK